jgi:PAS domain S-box-containing protein
MRTEILVVEDEAIVAEDIRATLEGLGYSVARVASSADEAIRAASEDRPALALLDIRIQGGKDGIEAANRLREMGVPVVFLTSYSDDATLRRAKTVEPFGYLLKPFNERELRATIEVALYKHAIEERLAERERWFLTTLQSIGDGVIATDTAQRIAFMNRTAEALSGWTGQDAMGRRLEDVFRLVDERTGRAHESPAEQALREGATVGLPDDSALLTKSGAARAIQDSTAPIVDESGHALGAVVVFRDVAREREIEHALRESEACFRATFDASPLPKWVYDRRSLRILAANDAAVRHSGYDRSELLAMSIEDLGPGRAAYEPTGTATALGPADRIERHRRKDGTLVDVELWCSDLGFQGRATRLVTAHDVSYRLRLEHATNQATERYRALFYDNPWPAWMADAETLSFLEVNDAATALYGYARDEFLAMPLSQLGEGEAEAVRQIAAERGVVQVGVRRHRRKGGESVEVDVAGHFMLLGGRRTVLVVARDVTEQRRLEERLRQAHKLEAIGRLAGGVAHDFNNLLVVILTYASLLLADPEIAASARPELEEIEKAGRRAAELTRQLLTFSRQRRFESNVIQINDVVRDLTTMLPRVLGENVDFATSLGAVGMILADPGGIEQVLMNLVLNARDAMPNGGRLLVETASVELDEAYAHRHVDVLPGPYVMLAVSDTGTGMDERTLAHIFDPFFTTKELGKGTGLGLSTVFGIVRQCGGHIDVDSEPAKGSTFRVYFPKTNDLASTSELPPTPTAQSRGWETILVVEDEEPVRAVVGEALRRLGYRVLEASNAGAALDVARDETGTIHLLLTDVVLPEAMGPDLLARLRLRRPAMRVLVMSGYTGKPLERGSERPPPAHRTPPDLPFLPKPFTLDVLARRVRQVLD